MVVRSTITITRELLRLKTIAKSSIWQAEFASVMFLLNIMLQDRKFSH